MIDDTPHRGVHHRELHRKAAKTLRHLHLPSQLRASDSEPHEPRHHTHERGLVPETHRAESVRVLGVGVGRGRHRVVRAAIVGGLVREGAVLAAGGSERNGVGVVGTDAEVGRGRSRVSSLAAGLLRRRAARVGRIGGGGGERLLLGLGHEGGRGSSEAPVHGHAIEAAGVHVAVLLLLLLRNLEDRVAGGVPLRLLVAWPGDGSDLELAFYRVEIGDRVARARVGEEVGRRKSRVGRLLVHGGGGDDGGPIGERRRGR